MSACLRFALVLLCTCTVLGHNLKKSHHHLNHDTAMDSRYAAVLHDLSATTAGADLGDAKMTDLTSSIQGVFSINPAAKGEAKTSKDEASTKPAAKAVIQRPIEFLVKPARPSVEHIHMQVSDSHAKAARSAKLDDSNITAVAVSANMTDTRQAENTTLVNSSGTVVPTDVPKSKENKTQIIEEAVVSLPMASFALEEPAPAPNKTVPKFPGNATEKAAWDEKEKFLEKEVEILKAKLNNVSVNAQIHDAGTNTSDKHESKKITMSSAFTGEPLKKVASVFALQANVAHGVVVADEESAHQNAAASTGWLSSLISRLARWSSSPMAPKTPMISQSAPTQKPVQVNKQDSERTAQAAHDENQHDIQVNDAWNQLEEDDANQQESVRREDTAERQRAESPEDPHTPTKSELQGRHGTQMSGFWSKLEKEDYNIEQTVRADDLVKYAELTQAQDKRVADADSKLNSNSQNMERTSLRRNTDVPLAIHEPWLRKEQRDNALEREIHDAPDLQMLQLQHHHSRAQGA